MAPASTPRRQRRRPGRRGDGQAVHAWPQPGRAAAQGIPVPGKEVRVRRDGNRVILEPMEIDVQAWLERSSTHSRRQAFPARGTSRAAADAAGRRHRLRQMICLDTNAAIALLDERIRPVAVRGFEEADALGEDDRRAQRRLFELWFGAAKSAVARPNAGKIADVPGGPDPTSWTSITAMPKRPGKSAPGSSARHADRPLRSADRGAGAAPGCAAGDGESPRVQPRGGTSRRELAGVATARAARLTPARRRSDGNDKRLRESPSGGQHADQQLPQTPQCDVARRRRQGQRRRRAVHPARHAADADPGRRVRGPEVRRRRPVARRPAYLDRLDPRPGEEGLRSHRRLRPEDRLDGGADLGRRRRRLGDGRGRRSEALPRPGEEGLRHRQADARHRHPPDRRHPDRFLDQRRPVGQGPGRRHEADRRDVSRGRARSPRIMASSSPPRARSAGAACIPGGRT